MASPAVNIAYSQIPSSTLQAATTRVASAVKRSTALILGRPGGGKGTISNKILKDYDNHFHHLSTGDVLREHVRNKTKLGEEAHSYMKAGALVPDDLMIRLLNDAKQSIDYDKGLLLDGFPRTVTQAKALEHTTPVDMVINLDVPIETIVERISDRWIHPSSGRVYSYSYNPPKVEGKDDLTGEPLMQRDDDRPECVRKRLETYEETTAPLIDYYGERGILKSFKGTKSDVIYVDVKEWLGTKFD